MKTVLFAASLLLFAASVIIHIDSVFNLAQINYEYVIWGVHLLAIVVMAPVIYFLTRKLGRLRGKAKGPKREFKPASNLKEEFNRIPLVFRMGIFVFSVYAVAAFFLFTIKMGSFSVKYSNGKRLVSNGAEAYREIPVDQFRELNQMAARGFSSDWMLLFIIAAGVYKKSLDEKSGKISQ